MSDRDGSAIADPFAINLLADLFGGRFFFAYAITNKKSSAEGRAFKGGHIQGSVLVSTLKRRLHSSHS